MFPLLLTVWNTWWEDLQAQPCRAVGWFQVYFCWSLWHCGGFGPGLCSFQGLGFHHLRAVWLCRPQPSVARASCFQSFQLLFSLFSLPLPFLRTLGGGRLPCCFPWSGSREVFAFSWRPQFLKRKKEKLSWIAFNPRNCRQTYLHEPECIIWDISKLSIYFYNISVSSFVLCLKLVGRAESWSSPWLLI